MYSSFRLIDILSIIQLFKIADEHIGLCIIKCRSVEYTHSKKNAIDSNLLCGTM
jgi:hypothetical protein